MSDGTKRMVEATLEIAKRDDCHKKLLPSDIRRVCCVALNKIEELEKCYEDLQAIKLLINDAHVQDNRHRLGVLGSQNLVNAYCLLSKYDK